jgi:chemotaxis regulatin CheY-phosphate phosphatase CheZ
MSKLGDAFKNLASAAKETVSEGIETVIEKSKEIDVGDAFDRVKETTASMMEKAKETGEAVITTTQKHTPSVDEVQDKAKKITETGRSILKSMVDKISK